MRVLMLFCLACAAALGAIAPAHSAITTTTTLDASANPISGDVRLGYRVEACAPSGAPLETGTVQFFDGATLVATVPLATSPVPGGATACAGGYVVAVFSFVPPTLPGVAPGAHTYTAVYSGDGFYAPSTSTAAALTIPPRLPPIATTVVLDGSANAVTGDTRLGFQVISCAPAEAPLQTGTMQIYDGAALVLTVPLGTFYLPDSTPCAGGVTIIARPQVLAITLPAVAPGPHAYTAIYSGDAIYAPGTSAPLSLPVPARLPPIATTTTIDATVNVVTGDLRLTYLVTACAPDGAPVEIGSVVVFDNGAPIATYELPQTSFPFPSQPCTGGNTVSNGQIFALTIPGLSPGAHTIVAAYGGNAIYAASASSPQALTVPPRLPPIPTVTAIDGSLLSISGDVRISYVVAACAPSGAPVPQGTVTILDDGLPVTTVTLAATSPIPQQYPPCAGGAIVANYTIVAVTIPGVSAGTHTYVVAYSGDAYYAPSISSTLRFDVPPRAAQIPTTTHLDVTSNAVSGEVRIRYDVSACVPNGANPPDGWIEIFEGETVVATYALSTAQALSPSTCAGGSTVLRGVVIPVLLADVAPGTHVYTARYSGWGLYAASSSPAVEAHVTALPAVAPGQSYGGPTATLSGSAMLQLSGGGPLCGFTHAAFVPVEGAVYSPPSASAPLGVAFPHGLIGFITSGCTPGSTITFTLTLPANAVPASAYWKYGPTSDNASPHWYSIPVSVNGNIVTFSITDGGIGDDDLTANGTVVDVGGPAIAVASTAIPTLGEWGLRLTMLLVVAAAMLALRRRA